MNVVFYVSGAVAVIAALMVVTRASAMHALVNLIVSFLAIACVFWTMGAPFAAALQILVYAGAIMVLFVFAVMILNIGREEESMQHEGRNRLIWLVPAVLTAALLVEFVVAVSTGQGPTGRGVVGPEAVGRSLFTTYAIGVEIASVLLLAGLVAAFHYGLVPGRREGRNE